jgi:hypothetical protein
MYTLFEEVVVLNVDKRPSEFTRIYDTLKEFGYQYPISRFMVGKGELLPTQFYSRIDEPNVSREWAAGQFSQLPNSYHAFRAYQTIISQLRSRNVKSVLLLEDDCVFTERAVCRSTRIEYLMPLLKLNWDMLYLGANHTWAPTEQISTNLLKLNGSVCWHAVGLKDTVFDTILSWSADRPIDLKAAQELHPQFNCYAIWPSIAIQKPGYSSVEGKVRDYSEYWDNKGINHK